MANKKKSAAKKKQQPKPATESNGAASPVNGHDDDSVTEDSPSVEKSPSSSSEPPELEPVEDVDLIKQAEQVKEEGNAAFKASRFQNAIESYSKAIGTFSSLPTPTSAHDIAMHVVLTLIMYIELNPTEPTYLTNRARRIWHLNASNLRSLIVSRPPLSRLPIPKQKPSSVLHVLTLDPKNAAALTLQKKVQDLEGHLKNFESARGRKDWGMSRLALDKCGQAIESEGGDIPTQWRLWRIELELARGNWDAAGMAANDALRSEPNSPDVLTLRGLIMFLSAKTAQALSHVQSALRLDPGHEPAQRLRKRVKDVDRLKEEGNVAFKGGRLSEATQKYSEALDRIGENEDEGKGGHVRAMLLSNRATTLVKLSRHEDALVDTDASLALNPHSFKALRTRARIHLHLEKYDNAVADFKSAIEQAERDGSSGDADVRALKGELKKAELALKRSKTKDYYKILGVARDCSDMEIKKGYRRESLKHHPDKGGDEEKFKLVVEANSVLSDPRRRERYDNGDDEEGGGDGMAGMDLSELFAQFHGGGFPGGGGGFGGGPGFGGGGFSSGGFSSGGFGGRGF
ncbi:hypothetical protein EUX98_g9592 [Antrodiella citrinella]|uniref:J domain-containing protein n=1 Tax=Antrodiella citrinella TaxID=2447956 RepID=A0A4S4LR43_9APHY|nr:hypothetical protein EUX98_g9592 [Antrodiella citrinella]